MAFYTLTVRRGSLTGPAAVTALGLGALVTVTWGAGWLLPLFVFFLSSALISRWLPTAADAGDVKDKQARDVVQVLCNGGVYGLVALLQLDPALLLVSMAVATSDTWASEIGKYFRQPTYDILRWRRVPPGLSGGISLSGTMGGAAGAILIATLGFALVSDFSLTSWLIASGFGFIGMLVDSILGAALQARYRNHVTGQFSDAPSPSSQLAHGLSWMTNDLVNLLSIGAVTLVAYLLR